MAKKTTIQLIDRLTRLEEALKARAPSIVTNAGKAFLIEKKEEIATRGVGRYSKTTYSASFLKGKELSSSGKSFLDNKIKNKELTNWAGLRSAEGLQVSFVDLWYSGKMINSTTAQKGNNTTYKYFVVIGGRNKDSKRKLFANYERYGDFLRPNDEQHKNFQDSVKTAVLGLITKTLK